MCRPWAGQGRGEKRKSPGAHSAGCDVDPVPAKHRQFLLIERVVEEVEEVREGMEGIGE